MPIVTSRMATTPLCERESMSSDAVQEALLSLKRPKSFADRSSSGDNQFAPNATTEALDNYAPINHFAESGVVYSAMTTGPSSILASVDGATGDSDEDESEEEEAVESGKHLLVDHSYTNFAVVSDGNLQILDQTPHLFPESTSSEEAAVTEMLKTMACRFASGKKLPERGGRPFPAKLMDVVERGDLADIIHWMPHGRAFIVRKPKDLAAQVLPRFFKQTKFLSFTRQLNLWGFKRITKGVDAGAYYHPLFLRGRPYLTKRMTRLKVKGTGIKLSPNPDEEPNFYKDYPFMERLNDQKSLAPLPPLPPERVASTVTEAKEHKDASIEVDLQHVRHHQPLDYMSQYRHGVGSMINAQHHMSYANKDVPLHPEISSFPYPNQESLTMGDTMLNRSYTGGNYGRFGLSGLLPTSMPSSSAYPSKYENVLLAPGLNLNDGSCGVRFGTNLTGLGRHPPINDPILDELSLMARNRHSQNTTTQGGIFPQQNLTSEKFFEHIRDADHNMSLRRDQLDVNSLHRGGRPCESVSSASLSGPSGSYGVGSGLFDRYQQMPSLHPQAGRNNFSHAYQGGITGMGTRYSNIETFGTSVREALREAHHLEELAMVQRAKAMNLAFAGAMQVQSMLGSTVPNASDAPVSAPSSVPSEVASVISEKVVPSVNMRSSLTRELNESQLSFGRPFGKMS